MTAQTSMVVTDSYNEEKNQTTLTLLPYGNIVIPDKWAKVSYNNVSKQHFFKNSDSITIAVTKNPKKNYPFFKKKQTDKNFVTEFVNWDAEYWQKQGFEIKRISDNSNDGFLIWQVLDAKKISTIFLFGSKNDLAYNFAVVSKGWSNEKAQEFLINLFRTN